MLEAVGWLGAVLFAVCGVPQAVKTIKTKSANDFSTGFVLMWLGGEVCMIVYALFALNNAQLLFNYLGNLACLLPILYYKFKR